jgi:F0F1-type ATP synthase membrane subunit b/b'
MLDNPMDKAKEKVNKASHETRDSYEDVKSSAKSTFKSAGVEGKNAMDELKKTASKAPSDLKGAAKKTGRDLK